MDREIHKISEGLLEHVKGSKFKFLRTSAKEATVETIHLIEEDELKILIPGAELLRMTKETFDTIPNKEQMEKIQSILDEGSLESFTVDGLNIQRESGEILSVSALELEIDEL